MNDLRKQVIKLAHEAGPGELRDKLLPLLEGTTPDRTVPRQAAKTDPLFKARTVPRQAAKTDPLFKAVQQATDALLKVSGRGSQLDRAKDLVDRAFTASTKHPRANSVHKSLNQVPKNIAKAEAALREAAKYANEAESWF